MRVLGLNWVLSPGGFRPAELIVPHKLNASMQASRAAGGQGPKRRFISSSIPEPNTAIGTANGVKYRPEGSAPNGVRMNPPKRLTATPARRRIPARLEL